MWRGASKADLAAPDFSGSLAERLLEITANVRQFGPADRLEAPERFVRELESAAAEAAILARGATAPPFTLADARDHAVSSADLLRGGPLVINFFRGRWCPYCIAELETWQALLSEVQAAGATLVAISPQTARHNDFTAQQHRLTFPVLSDTGNNVARRFGLVHRIPDYLVQHYRRVFVNFENLHGDSVAELPLPATYVITRDGVIVFAEAFADFKRRPEPRGALAALQSC